MSKKIRLCLVASGSGSDAESIMKAWKAGIIPDCEIAWLVSTKEGAGCLERAEKFGVKNIVISKKELKKDFSRTLDEFFIKEKIDLVFLVGCIHMVLFNTDIPIYNIHPADIHLHGGDKMYGLAVHEHVLLYICDEIYRKKKTVNDRFFSYPTVHEVSQEYDKGDALLRASVEIPNRIIRSLPVDKAPMISLSDLEEPAKELQNVVLQNEWLMLPTAVNMAIRRILEK